MISNDLDFERSQRQLQVRTRVQITEFLQPSAAHALTRCLQDDVPWQLAERSAGSPRTTPRGGYPSDVEHAALLQRAYALAADEYQFAYDSYMLVRAAKEGWDEGLLVHGVLGFLNTPQFIAFARQLTGDASISHVNAQCTRYRPGHFLLPHVDQPESEEIRRYAYVINLSPQWRADWGGQLQFLDAGGAVVETFLPRFNSLSLFQVPQRHQVTLVAPWAAANRLAITGWWLAR